jgi:predicted transcriptional regulator
MERRVIDIKTVASRFRKEVIQLREEAARLLTSADHLEQAADAMDPPDSRTRLTKTELERILTGAFTAIEDPET